MRWCFPGQGSQFDRDGRRVGDASGRRRRCSTSIRGHRHARSSRAAVTRKPCATTEFVAAGVARVRRGRVPGAGGRGRRRRGRRGGPFARRVRRAGGGRTRCCSPTRCELVVVRGDAMQRAGEERPGAMSGVARRRRRAADGALRRAARDGDVLVVANQNSPAQSVDQRQRRRDRAGSRRSRRNAKIRAVRLQRRGRVPLAADGTGGRSRCSTCSTRIDVSARPRSRSPRT